MFRKIIHVGFAKTGTSTLQQHLFPSLAAGSNFPYLGKSYSGQVNYASYQQRRPITFHFKITGPESTRKFTMHLSDDKYLIHLLNHKTQISDYMLNKSFIYSNEVIVDPCAIDPINNDHSCNLDNSIWRMLTINEIFHPLFILSVRDPRDWIWSLYRHYAFFQETENKTPSTIVEFLEATASRFSMIRIAFDVEFRISLTQLFPDMLFLDSMSLLQDPSTKTPSLCNQLGLRATHTIAPIIENQGMTIWSSTMARFMDDQKDLLDSYPKAFPKLNDIFQSEEGSPLLKLKLT